MKQFHIRHSCSLHGTVFSADPRSLQSFPPLDGGGLVQVLVSVLVPFPHVTVQLEVISHSEQPPSTGGAKNIKENSTLSGKLQTNSLKHCFGRRYLFESVRFLNTLEINAQTLRGHAKVSFFVRYQLLTYFLLTNILAWHDSTSGFLYICSNRSPNLKFRVSIKNENFLKLPQVW